jgi:hypothetical protein
MKPVKDEPLLILDVRHMDELNDMTLRILGLIVALDGLNCKDRERAGVLRLAEDVYGKMASCARAFADERLGPRP